MDVVEAQTMKRKEDGGKCNIPGEQIFMRT
jgi:hypothetical protein